jgi:hypothetical protein
VLGAGSGIFIDTFYGFTQPRFFNAGILDSKVRVKFDVEKRKFCVPT